MIDGFFDIENRLNTLSRIGDPLLHLSEIVLWEAFRSTFEILGEKWPKAMLGINLLMLF